MGYGTTAYNKMYALTALFGRFGVRKMQSARCAFMHFVSPTFFDLRKMLTHFFHLKPKNVAYNETLCDIKSEFIQYGVKNIGFFIFYKI